MDHSKRARALVGTTLKEKYHLDGLLGVGGMASVYAATHRNSKRFAVKMLHPELSAHADLRTRFMREGYVANQVGHPNAVAVLDDDVTESGAAFLVMDLLEGETVASAAEARGDKLPVQVVMGIAYQVLDVLAAANARGIVHRDIKPENLFATRDGQVKVLDFGIARMRDAQGALTTHTGHTLGTPAFMSPEQALGRTDEIDGRTDVWGVGATMFSLLSGHMVHEASTAQEQMVFAATKPARTLADVGVTDVPPVVSEIIAKALAFRRDDRWESAAAMRTAVGDAYRELHGEAPSSASVAVVVAQVKLVVAAPSDSPSDPLAATARADSIVSGDPKPVLLRDTARQRATRMARVTGGAALLVGGGIIIGVWVMRTNPQPQSAVSATAPPTVTSAIPSVAASAPPPPPSDAPSASAPASIGSAAPKPSSKPRPVAVAPSVSTPIQKHDNFDHQ